MPKLRSRATISPAMSLGYLLKSHYLADEFPSVITTTKFSEYCVANYAALDSLADLLKRTTLYGTFSVPRSTTRRMIALPHPSSQLAMSLIIAENRSAIAKVIGSPKLSLYDTALSKPRERMFGGLNFKARTQREAEILARYPVILVTDIGNFFHTIYSHSLPWSVLGKQNVKDIREGKDKKAQATLHGHWANQLDLAIQRGNSRETFGIPVGPDTSRMVAEILLSGIHNDASVTSILNGNDGYRLVDDFFIGFSDETTARQCLDTVRRALWEYNLHLNEAKTRIASASTFFDGGWRHEIETFPIPRTSAIKQREAVQRLMEIALYHCSVRGDSLPASFFCGRLTSLTIVMSNFTFIRDCLLRIARDFTICLKSVAKFVTQYRSLVSEPNSLVVVRNWCQQIFNGHTNRGHDLEVAWTLAICGILGITVSQAFMGINERVVSPVVLAILGLLRADGLLAEPWDDWKTPFPGSGSINDGRYWLPHYEAVRRGWTKDATVIGTIQGDKMFADLLKADVTFLDESDFLSQIPFAPEPPQTKPFDMKKPLIAVRERVRSGRQTSASEYE
jgi:hypothetical protein